MGLLNTKEWAKFTDLWPETVRSETRLLRSRRLSAPESALSAEPRREFSTTDVSSRLTPTTREREAPTPAPAESPRTSPSERFDLLWCDACEEYGFHHLY